MSKLRRFSASPPPPAGYASWLDYAVCHFDTRTPYLELLLVADENEAVPGREQLQHALENELRELRRAARVSDTLPLHEREGDAERSGLVPLRWVTAPADL